jgi:hypothetical protein
MSQLRNRPTPNSRHGAAGDRGRHRRGIDPSVRHVITSSAKQTINDDGTDRYFAVFALDSSSAGSLFAEGSLESVSLSASALNRSIINDGCGGAVEVYSTSDLR